MELIETILSNIIVFQIVTDIIKVIVGAGLCFGALKWRRGLLTTTAIGWGAFLGCTIAILLGDAIGGIGMVLCILIGIIALPILTYTIPGVNRFVLGFLVSTKLFFMLTTVLAKANTIEIPSALIIPLVAGSIAGLALMAWTRVRVSAFVLACTFIGASEIAPVISEWINRILYGFTGNIGYLIDPVDLIFSLFKIELTDQWMLISMVVLMAIGGYKQINNLRANCIPLDTPLIGFEVPRKDNGKIYTGNKTIDTL